MRILLVSLLAAAVCLHLADSLMCYTCFAATSDKDCLTKTTCSSSDNFCVTTTGSLLDIGFITNKRCAAVCEPNEVEFILGDISLKCCDYDLCNDGTERA
uniref:Lymphocyte antigen 6E-like n=1 Tax=Geotrypetes seraphini TaxID=260995 RepID=A0A6P8PZB5_GEOSA|nr:lymphocyte antigen 6E-like [Geotrypetes seraphini]